jgi:DNA-binding Lrp family transcriptional regulator
MSVPAASKKIAWRIFAFHLRSSPQLRNCDLEFVSLRTLPDETTPVEHNDPVNARILAISEDKVVGFVREPFREIAVRSGLPLEKVLERIRAMLEAGTVRRVRQTLLATNLAQGALVAWKVPPEKIDAAFDWMSQRDPFSGHVVLRSTDAITAGSEYKLWTTLKVPQGFSLRHHAETLARIVGAEDFRLMPAKGIFTLGVGHVRRKNVAPGTRTEEPATMIVVQPATLSEHEWKILTALKREFAPFEIRDSPWLGRAEEAGVPLEEFFAVAEDLTKRKIIGRFSTFLEHVKPSLGGVRVTRFNGLFHWAVPPGREVETGGEVGRHEILTHCYWREAGPEFRNVNIMAVAHGTDKARLLEHKAAIDRHLTETGIPVSYTNVFWGGRSEIKPSEISPQIYRQWLQELGAETGP